MKQNITNLSFKRNKLFFNKLVYSYFQYTYVIISWFVFYTIDRYMARKPLLLNFMVKSKSFLLKCWTI